MARIIADELGGEVDVVLVRKLREPGKPEFAISSVNESGWIYLGGHVSELTNEISPGLALSGRYLISAIMFYIRNNLQRIPVECAEYGNAYFEISGYVFSHPSAFCVTSATAI